MSWMGKLYETYEQALLLDLPEENKLMPVSHTLQNAHINIVIDGHGNFIRAKVIEKTQVILPATESSAGRSSGEAPHPLADKVQYVAADYKKYGGNKAHYFNGYKKQLEGWCESNFAHAKVKAVLAYIAKETVVQDLVANNILYIDENLQLLTSWTDISEEREVPPIFKVLPKEKGELDQGNALICWSVEIDGDPCSHTWLDESLFQSWIEYDAQSSGDERLCFVSGKIAPVANNHPAKLRHTGDKAKLISSNDSGGFTYRGRFINSEQASDISFEVTQKAHNALRWLISNAPRSARNGDQVVVAWAVSGKSIPCPSDDINVFDLDDLGVVEINAEDNFEPAVNHSIDLGQSFAKNLSCYMAGYRATLNPTENIIILAVDSATPGRMGIVYYRDFFAAEYLEKIERWHNEFSWPQRISKESHEANGKKGKSTVSWLPSAPSPYSILNTAYGDIIKSSEALKKNLYERIIPCIVEGRSFPQDLVHLAIRRVSNPSSCEKWEWEKSIGVACALYRGFFNRHPNHEKRRNYSMSLETDKSSRDYLYGRLLAIAERIEEVALNVAGENRPTTAARLMQRFADRPFSTWRNLELALIPYMQRLQNSRAGFLVNRKKELDEVLGLFNTSDFTNDKALSGEFLLAYHCQRQILRNKPETDFEQN